MDRLGDMQAFVRVAETGSVSRAAEQMAVAKSAVSRRLRELEARLGAQLLQRSPRSLALTDEGRDYYRRCVQILADMAEADAAVGAAQADLAGTIRLAVPVSFGQRHLGEPIARFARRHPRIRFEIDFDDRAIDVAARNIDLALRIGRLKDGDLIARRLARIRHVVAASPDWWAEHGMPRHPDELKRHVCLRYSNLQEREVWSWKAPDGSLGRVAVPIRLQAGNGDFLCDAAAAGLGVAMEPTFIAHRHLADGRLVPALSDYAWSNVHLWAVYPPTRHLSRRVRAFIDLLVESFAGTPPWDRPAA